MSGKTEAKAIGRGIRTIKPQGCTAPADGPLGEMLIAMRRSRRWRST